MIQYNLCMQSIVVPHNSTWWQTAATTDSFESTEVFVFKNCLQLTFNHKVKCF